jgi:hypothetical protein
VTFYYDGTTGDLLGQANEVPSPPPGAGAVQIPAGQMVCADPFESDPQTLGASVRFTFAYDRIVDSLGSGGTYYAVVPRNLNQPDRTDIYYTRGGLPGSEAMNFDDVLACARERVKLFFALQSPAHRRFSPMRVPSLLRSSLVALSLAALAAAPACSKKGDTATAEGLDKSGEAITEENDAGSITWSVSPDGKVAAALKSTDGQPITKDVSGQLTWKASSGDAKVPASVDGKSGLVTASGPKLEDDLTEIDYAFTVAGKPWTGALHVPKGGTKALADDAKQAAASPVAADAKGPNGGVLQIVGKDRIEIVADKATGQVRVYVLDADLKPVDAGDRRIRLAFGGESPEIVVLVPDAKGHYCTGKLSSKVDPVRITVSVTVKEETHTAIVGWAPGARLVVGARAPRVKILVASWDAPAVDVKVRGEGRGPGVVVRADDDDDAKVDVKIKEKHGGNGKAKISVKIH